MAQIIKGDGPTGLPQNVPNIRLIIPTLDTTSIDGTEIGQIVIDTGVLYYWTGSAWVEVAIAP